MNEINREKNCMGKENYPINYYKCTGCEKINVGE
jgi:hypothetical protein